MSERPKFKHIKKDYQTKNLKNPFFHYHHKTGKRPAFSLKCLLLASLVLIIFAVWFFCAAPLWRIRNVQVIGLTRLGDGDLKNIIWSQAQGKRFGIFHQNNLFLFDKRSALKTIAQNYNFSSLIIKKIWPGTIEMKISERPIAFIFQQGSQSIFSSATGDLIREVAVSEANRSQYWILDNQGPSDLVASNSQIGLDAANLSFMVELHTRLGAYLDMPMDRLIINGDANSVEVKFINGPLVYFNTTLSAADQISRLLLVKKDKIKDNFNKVNYIDLRYGDRIFINP